MLRKLLSENNYKLQIIGCKFILFLLSCGLLFVICNCNEVLFLPYTPEEVVLMQGLQVLSEGKDACGNNPAGCGLENRKSFSFGYVYWRMHENLYSVKLFFPSKFANIGINLKYANLGETEFVSSEPGKVEKENLYFVNLNTSFGKEIFFPGFFLGIDLSLGNLKLDRSLFLSSSKIGVIYIFNIAATELHFGSSLGMIVYSNNNVIDYGFGVKYFLPEYRTFLNLSCNKNLYDFITTSIETEILKNVVFLCGYETTFKKDLTNYSFGVRVLQRSFDISVGVRFNTELGWTLSTGASIKS